MVMPHEPTKGQRDNSLAICMFLGVLGGIGTMSIAHDNGHLTGTEFVIDVISMPISGSIYWAIWQGIKKLASLFRRRAPS